MKFKFRKVLQFWYSTNSVHNMQQLKFVVTGIGAYVVDGVVWEPGGQGSSQVHLWSLEPTPQLYTDSHCQRDVHQRLGPQDNAVSTYWVAID